MKRKHRSKAKAKSKQRTHKFFGPQSPRRHRYAHAIPPDPMTEPCLAFFRADAELITLMGAAVEGLASSLKELHVATPFAAMLQQLYQMMLSRAADNYLTYLADILALIFRKRPETLRSGEMVKLDIVLQHKAMEDLIAVLAERRVVQLSYQGMRELSKYLEEKLGFPLFKKAQQLQRAFQIVELRNLIVHNRGVVNRTFLSKVEGFSAGLGKTLVFDLDTVLSAVHFLGRSVADIDLRAGKKFGLPRPVRRRVHKL